MKATLDFNLPEEQESFDIALKSGKLASFLWIFDNTVLRNMTKYDRHPTQDRELTAEELALATEIRSKFWELLNEEGLGELI